MSNVAPSSLRHAGGISPTKVRGVHLITLVQHRDKRGPLAVLGQDEAALPFVPARIFFTYEANEHSRGAHAHRECEQILICTAGSIKVSVKDGQNEEVFQLSGPKQALHVGKLVWSEQFDHSPDAVLMVLASQPYEESDYIRNAEQWQKLVQA